MPTMGACWRIRIPAESEGTALSIAYSFVFIYFMATKSFAVGAYLKLSISVVLEPSAPRKPHQRTKVSRDLRINFLSGFERSLICVDC